MLWGGYSEKVREIVARRILAKLDNNLYNEKHLGRPRYRDKDVRRQQTKPDKATWFREDGSTATIMLPSSSGSRLAKEVRATLARYPGPLGTKTKVLERPGPPIMTGLTRNNTFPRLDCHRETCPLANDDRGCKEGCSSEGILYAATCQKCYLGQVEEGILVYIGESSRTLNVRAGQHLRDLKARLRQEARGTSDQDKTSSFMFDHHMETHPDEIEDTVEDFKFKLLGTYRDPLTRQLMEAVKIKTALDKEILKQTNRQVINIESLNLRGEHFAPRERWVT